MTSTDLGALTSATGQPSIGDIEGAVALAVRAPSIHNTQPWRFVLTADALELWADRRRQLASTDLDGWALQVSCGGALYLAGLGLAAQGWRSAVERMPDPAEPDLLARIRFLGPLPAGAHVPAATSAAAERRHTERRPFGPGLVPSDLLDSLCAAVEDRALYAHLVVRPEERLDLAVAVSWADDLETTDPAYRTELGRWVRPDEATDEGVPATAVPHLAAGRPRHTEVPIRDFELGAPGSQPLTGDVPDEQPAYLVLFSRADDTATRLRAGEAYARLSVEAERLGLASSAMTQALDAPGVRARLRVLMSWPDHPQMILRIGWRPAGETPPPTPRRPVSAVLTVTRPDAAGPAPV